MTKAQTAGIDIELAIKTANSQVKELLRETFKELKESVSAKEGEEPQPPRLFFPNGIELIDLNFEAGLTEKTKLVIAIKIAGEKGAKEASVVLEKKAAE